VCVCVRVCVCVCVCMCARTVQAGTVHVHLYIYTVRYEGAQHCVVVYSSITLLLLSIFFLARFIASSSVLSRQILNRI
jgi:hypothetical protein